MHKIERHNLIMRQLQDHGSILVSDACAMLGCSDQTIRRDFQELEKQGKLNRIHGGAFIPAPDDKGVPVRLREKLIVAEKIAMAKIASRLIKDRDVIMLDSSTTCNALGRQILADRMNVTVITNSTDMLSWTDYDSINTSIVSTGGVLDLRLGSFYGAAAVNTIRSYIADVAFISCNAISKKFGILDKIDEQKAVRQAMLSQAMKKYIIVDHTKFDDIANVFIADFSEINGIITDCEPSEEWMSFFSDLGISVVWQ